MDYLSPKFWKTLAGKPVQKPKLRKKAARKRLNGEVMTDQSTK